MTKSLLVAHVAVICVMSIIARAALQFRDVTDALAFYGVYHRDTVNQVIHFFGVPGILWSMLLFLAQIPLPHYYLLPMITVSKLHGATDAHSVTYSTLVALAYALFYIKIDPVGGLLYAPIIYAMYVHVVRLTLADQREARKKYDQAPWTGTGRLLKMAALVHFLAWYVQIHPGHGIFEGAAPAITKSFGGAMTSAPLFAFYEGLWFLGIHTDLQQQTQILVEEITAQMCEAGANMRICSTL